MSLSPSLAPNALSTPEASRERADSARLGAGAAGQRAARQPVRDLKVSQRALDDVEAQGIRAGDRRLEAQLEIDEVALEADETSGPVVDPVAPHRRSRPVELGDMVGAERAREGQGLGHVGVDRQVGVARVGQAGAENSGEAEHGLQGGVTVP